MSSKLETTNRDTTTYVHPLDSRSKSTLSEKSLELCTENLGSETGTEVIEDDSSSCCHLFSSSPSSEEKENGGNVREQQQRKKCAVKKVTSRNYPPPLTTIRGDASVQLRLRPHRQDGRLIIKAAKAPLPQCSLFQAERSHGRLRLRLFKHSISEDEFENEATAEEEEEEEEEEQQQQQEGGIIVHESDFDEENAGYMWKEEEEEEEEGMNRNIKDVGDTMGIKKLRRPGRCKEGEPEKKDLLNWEALCVSTS